MKHFLLADFEVKLTSGATQIIEIEIADYRNEELDPEKTYLISAKDVESEIAYHIDYEEIESFRFANRSVNRASSYNAQTQTYKLVQKELHL